MGGLGGAAPEESDEAWSKVAVAVVVAAIGGGGGGASGRTKRVDAVGLVFVGGRALQGGETDDKKIKGSEREGSSS